MAPPPIGTTSPPLPVAPRLVAGLLARVPFAGPRRGRLTVHRAAGLEGPASTLGFQRSMLVVRLAGLGMVIGLTPLYRFVDSPLAYGGALVVGLVVAIQVLAFRQDRSAATWRSIALAGLAADSVAGYLVGHASIGAAEWIGFVLYPLLSLEGAIFFGMAGAMSSCAVSLGVYVGQSMHRLQLGHPWSTDQVMTVASLFVVEALFVGLYAGVSRRVRGDLTTLLRLSALLAHQESPTRIVQALDTHLRELLGARVRSVALARPEGGYDILRWRSPERRVIRPEAIAEVSRIAGRDIERDFRERHAITLVIQPGQDGLVAEALGLPSWVRAITMVPIRSDGETTGVLPVLWDTPRTPGAGELDLLHGLADQTGLAFAQAQLRRARELAATDSLTGLANHRAFLDLLGAALAEARQRDDRLAVLFCDLDRFKAVNDRHGHAVGDLLLRRIAEVVRGAARASDIVARYGGDELALILPGAGGAAALEAGRRLRDEVRRVEHGMGIDLTVGVALYPDDGDSQELLLARADAAMYAGKRLGGGRVVLAAEIARDV
jgi:diguanylate cyclase (GGDEF)-like protein